MSDRSEPPDPTDPTDPRDHRGRRADRHPSESPDHASDPRAEREASAEVPASADEAHGESEPRESTPITQQVGRMAIVVLAVLFGVFAVANSQAVDFSWVFGETEVRPDPEGPGEVGGVPLIVLLLITFVIGALLGALLQWYSGRSRRARRDRR